MYLLAIILYYIMVINLLRKLMNSKQYELKLKLIKTNAAYRLGCPIISDAEYDILLDQFKQAVSEEEYNELRISLLEKEGEIPHPYIMGSLDKVKSDEEDTGFEKWIKAVKAEELHVSAKVDGCSLRLEYKNGELVDAVTRGDGYKGTSIYNKALYFAPVNLNIPFTGHIRGECTLTKTSFRQLCENTKTECKNLRNSTVGLVNSKEVPIENVSLLTFIAYEIIGSWRTKSDQYQKLIDMKFTVPNNWIIPINTNIPDLKKTLNAFFNILLNEAEYDIDGLVLTPSTNKIFENEYIPKNIIAYKTNQLVKETKLLDIEWNISKAGYFTPVALLEPIELGGAMVSRASLYNVENVRNLNIAYGSTVTVLKAGDIIPKVCNVDNTKLAEVKLIPIPTICPHCNTILITSGVELRCTNTKCKGQSLLKVTDFIIKIGIENVSTKSLENFGIINFTDLFKWRPDPAYKSQIKFYDEITKKIFNNSKVNIFTALDFDGVGSKIINKLIEAFGFDNVINGRIDINGVLPKGIKETTINNFFIPLQENKLIFDTIISDERYSEPQIQKSTVNSANLPLIGKSYCFTGSLNTMTRPDAQKRVEELGGKAASGISKTLTYLVTNDTESGSSKNQKAKLLGVKIIDEKEFLTHINNVEFDLG